jgi:YbgC/YbaW family acyl-CoA thioester hydrolase
MNSVRPPAGYANETEVSQSEVPAPELAELAAPLACPALPASTASRLNTEKVVPDHFHFSYRRLVEFADTDLAGIMHFANFLRFAECAEHAFFRSLGFRVHTAEGELHQGWPRLEVSCKFLKPARFEQVLEVGLRIEEIRTSTLRYGFWILAADVPGHPLLATGVCSIIHVALDTKAHQIRKAPIPADLRHALESVVASPRTSSHTHLP